MRGVVRQSAGDVRVEEQEDPTIVESTDAEHWHGATRETVMARYALLDANEDGSDPTHWLEPVTDDQYLAAHEAAR